MRSCLMMLVAITASMGLVWFGGAKAEDTPKCNKTKFKGPSTTCTASIDPECEDTDEEDGDGCREKQGLYDIKSRHLEGCGDAGAGGLADDCVVENVVCASKFSCTYNVVVGCLKGDQMLDESTPPKPVVVKVSAGISRTCTQES